MKVERLTLGSHEPRVKERQCIATDLHEIAGPLEACNDVVGIDHLNLLTVDTCPHPKQTVG